MSQKKIYIGTAGWNYKHWQGVFYPQDLAQSKWLDYYVDYFSTVEINNSFYNLPKPKTLEKWYNSVPDDFEFSVKASRYITHMKKLKAPRDAVKRFINHMKSLKGKSAVILFQLPPRWKFNGERLRSFIKLLPDDYLYTFEFRDKSWWNEETFEILESNNSAFCIYELAGTHTPLQITADFVYLRLHGPDGAYEGSYDQATLEQWADKFEQWLGDEHSIYCYFDNDQNGYAVKNAMSLKNMIE